MKFVIVGKGNLGKRLFKLFSSRYEEVEFMTQTEFWEAAWRYREFEDSIIIYTSWITNVDSYDSDPITAFRYMEEFKKNIMNHFILGKFIYISSNMAERPIPNLYGWSKHFAEELLKKELKPEQLLIIRTQYLYGGDKQFNYPEAAIDMTIRPTEIHKLCEFIWQNFEKSGLLECYGEKTTMYKFVRDNYNPKTEPVTFDSIRFLTHRNKDN